MNEKTAVLVMAYGTPRTPEEIEGYYTRIRHGRPPSPEQLDDLVRRYEAIGGTSPLNERTAAQVAGIAEALEQLAPGRFDVHFGAKYAEPLIEQAAADIAAQGYERVVCLVLTPHFSTIGTGSYLDRARAALGEEAELVAIERWWDAPGFAPLLAERVRQARAELPGDVVERSLVLFTAHSLPVKILEVGDPYPIELSRSAEAIAEAAGLDRFEVAWQSAGRTPEPWLGPDILEVVRQLPEHGVEGVVVCPVGFVADHLEVLFDVDVEAAAVAEEVGIALVRTASLNDDPAFIELLARRVSEAAEA
jgi:protoporphyrin/coproporphyrin ferrochelatase